MRVVSPSETQELMTMGKVLQTLTISPQTKEVPEAKLNERPVLLRFRKEKTVTEAYKLLYSLLELCKPVPKPRIKSFHQPGQQSSLMEALRRGIVTGESKLTLQHIAEIKIQQSALESNGSSVSSLTRDKEDVRLSTYKRLDSLEETIRELENTLIEISGHPTTEDLYTETTVNSASVQRTGSLTSETKKPPVPPKPPSFSPASFQVHCLLVLCRSLL